MWTIYCKPKSNMIYGKMLEKIFLISQLVDCFGYLLDKIALKTSVKLINEKEEKKKNHLWIKRYINLVIPIMRKKCKLISNNNNNDNNNNNNNKKKNNNNIIIIIITTALMIIINPCGLENPDDKWNGIFSLLAVSWKCTHIMKWKR